jgi:hypothetical protein
MRDWEKWGDVWQFIKEGKPGYCGQKEGIPCRRR